MARRVSLGDLAERSAPAVAPAPLEAAPEPAAPAEKPPARSSEPKRQRTTKTTAKRPSAASGEWQRFDAYERKEARLRSDQYGSLGDVARRLQRARTTKGERITENTLIRVAIDLLLSREGDLTGERESDLRRSLGL